MSASDPAVPPHNLEAERSVLGAVLVDHSYLEGLVMDTGLKPEHFFSDHHGWVFAAMLDLHRHGRSVDPLTVAQKLRQRGRLNQVGGVDSIQDLAQSVTGGEYAREYARIVRDSADLRELLRRTRNLLKRIGIE